MKNKLMISVVSGLVATGIMTMVGLNAPMMGLPRMNPAEMLSMMMGFPIIIGWIMHFMIGTIFSIVYMQFGLKYFKKLSNFILRGAIFGIVVFIIAQMMMAVNSMMMTPPMMNGTLLANLIGSIIGHIIYGITVTSMIKIISKA